MLKNQKLDNDILAIYYDTKRRYGAPKNSSRITRKRLACQFKTSTAKNGIAWNPFNCNQEYRHFSDNKPVTEKENILKQDFTATGINQKWCTDITYIHTQKMDGHIFASVMDFYSRKIIGWAYGTTMSADLAVKAVENACLNVSDTSGIILHSDLGTQYTSDQFEKVSC